MRNNQENKQDLRQPLCSVCSTITINIYELPAVKTNTPSIRVHFSQIYLAAGVMDDGWSEQPKSLHFHIPLQACWPKAEVHAMSVTQPVLLSSSITLTDAMANSQLEDTDTGLLFYIDVRIQQHWEYLLNTTVI